MTELKKKRKGWIRLLGAIVLSVLLFLGLNYSKLGGAQTTNSIQTQTFITNKIQQGNNIIRNLETQLNTKLVDVKEQEDTYGLGNLESIVSQLSAKWGIINYELALLIILLVTITLLAGWYLRKFRKKKWIGYIISFIGFLPILPIMVAGTLVYWMGKVYWMSGNARSNKDSVPREPLNNAANYKVANNTNIIDDWEQSFKRLEKLHS